MQNIVPIQITLQAVNATDIKNLVHDLSGTLGGIPNTDVPAQTTVSTVPTQSAPTQPQNQAPVQPPAPQQGYGQQSPQYGQQPTYGQQPPVQGQPGQQPYGQQLTQPQGAVPTTAPAYTIDQLGVAAQPVMDAGKGPDLIGWLQQQGAASLTALDPSKYGEFATFLRSLGGRI